MKNVCVKLKKISRILLICTLILGLLAGSCGVAVTALGAKGGTAGDTSAPQGGDAGDDTPSYVDPTEEYDDFSNEIALQDNVKILTEQESAVINAAVTAIESRTSGSNDYLYVTLDGARDMFSVALVANQIIYLQGDETTPFGEDRFFKVMSCSSYGNVTRLSLDEPYMEEVFSSIEMAVSELLTEENLVDAVFMEGVTAHFGDIESEFSGVYQQETFGDVDVTLLNDSAQVKAEPLGVGKPSDGAMENTATDSQIKAGNLIVNINADLVKQEDEDKKSNKEEDDDLVEGKSSLKLTGQFGIRDLTAHIVCEMPEAAQFEELYLGLSGEKFVQVDVVGQLSASAEMEDTKKDTALFTLEGLKEKRFLLSVFKFKGTTPIPITGKQFDKQKKSVFPTVYLLLYADWEGKISIEVKGGVDYTHGFNEGLQVFRKGEPCLNFVDYPYDSPFNIKDDGWNWHFNITIEAKTDLTLFGGSVVFYIAGVNVGEISLLRVGIEAEGKITIDVSSDDGSDKPNPVEAKGYVRGYLRIIEVKVKIKVEGKGFLKRIDFDVDFQFGLLDFTLFQTGTVPDKYKQYVVSTVPRPDTLESVIMLVCDVSGSMDSKLSTGETKLEASKIAAKTILDTTETWAANYEENYGIGLVQFASVAKPVALPHIDYPYLSACIDLMADGGGTCIYAGIDSALAQLDTVIANNKAIILMTDGQDNHDARAKESAQAAAAKGISLYTIGFGNDVDDSLLEELAEIAGGEYRFANTDNMLGILQGFMSAQHCATGKVLAETEGTVSQGETTQPTPFTVEYQRGDLLVQTVWPGSFLDTILIDPDGRKVDENYPNVIIDKSSIPTSIIVQNPIPGEWEMQIVGVETSYDEEPYFTIVSFKDTDPKLLNEPMDTKQKAAAYGMAIGFPVALISLLLLICLRKKAEE